VVRLLDCGELGEIALHARGELLGFAVDELEPGLPAGTLTPGARFGAIATCQPRPLGTDHSRGGKREQGDHQPAHGPDSTARRRCPVAAGPRLFMRLTPVAAFDGLAIRRHASPEVRTLVRDIGHRGERSLLGFGATIGPVRELLSDLERWHTGGQRIALARVVATRRSAPRPVGAKLAVSEAGELAGSVSGGCVENEVYEAARAVLRGGRARLLTYGISDDLALSVGLPCGGEIDVWVDEPDPALLTRLESVVRDDRRAVLLTDLEDGSTQLLEHGREDRADELIRTGQSRVVELAGRRVFADVFGPPPRLFVYGAVDTAEALSAAAKAIGWQTIVADARGKFATPERIPNADELIVAWPEDALATVQPDHGTAIVVLTHDDRFDVPMLVGALSGDAFYVGALGSRRNQERRRERLLEAGVDESALDRLSGPAGLDIGAHTPAETAVSILAEIMAVRAGREGGSLKHASGRIHAELR
jgi:xanthine dehydrogenase accessory factor